MLKKFLKMLHELGSVGVLGSLASCIVLVATAPRDSLVGYAAVAQGVAAVTQWVLVPSLAIVLLSGLLAIAINETYINAAWPWIKAVLGLSMFEGSLLTVSGSARHAAELSALAVAGQADPATMAEVLRTEWLGLWTISVVSIANIVIGVWRPRIIRSSPR